MVEDWFSLLQGGSEVKPKPVAQGEGAVHGHLAEVEEATEDEDADGEPEPEVGDGGAGLGGTVVGSQIARQPSHHITQL
jgi:hypothetical protein